MVLNSFAGNSTKCCQMYNCWKYAGCRNAYFPIVVRLFEGSAFRKFAFFCVAAYFLLLDIPKWLIMTSSKHFLFQEYSSFFNQISTIYKKSSVINYRNTLLFEQKPVCDENQLIFSYRKATFLLRRFMQRFLEMKCIFI